MMWRSATPAQSVAVPCGSALVASLAANAQSAVREWPRQNTIAAIAAEGREMSTTAQKMDLFYWFPPKEWVSIGGLLRSGVFKITPEVAASILEFANVSNRNVRRNRVASYAEKMRSGRWQVNGIPIVFHTPDVMLNGQHRLMGCVEADVPFATVLTIGVKPEAAPTIDETAKWSAGDCLTRDQKHYAATCGAAAKVVFLYLTCAMGKVNPMNDDLMEVIKSHPGIEASAPVIHSLCRGVKMMNPGTGTGLHYLFSVSSDADAATEFFNRVLGGQMIKAGQPEFALNRRLQLNMCSRQKMQQREILALTIKAWNASLLGRKIQKLGWRFDEPFPEIIGLPMQDLRRDRGAGS